MSDRKYRQRGYQDDNRDRQPPRDKSAGQPQQKPRGERPEGPRTPNMPGFRTVVRCHRCGGLVTTAVLVNTTCPKCSVALHCCAQCESFLPSARYECMQQISARIAPKDAFNTCDAVRGAVDGRARDRVGAPVHVPQRVRRPVQDLRNGRK